jgi:hypothetical protein
MELKYNSRYTFATEVASTVLIDGTMLIVVSGGFEASSISETGGLYVTAVSCRSYILDRSNAGDGTPEVGGVEC